MTNSEVGDLMYEVFVLAIQLAGPLLIISMLVGVVIAILQAATQVHEQTLTFVPKLIVIGLLLVLDRKSVVREECTSWCRSRWSPYH